jgi:hypothetical protein
MSKILKDRVCVCDDCARQVCKDSALNYRYDEETAIKRKRDIQRGLKVFEDQGGYLVGPVQDTIQSSDEICEVCGWDRAGYRHIFQLLEAPDIDEMVKAVMAQKAEDRKLGNQIDKMGKGISKHSKNVAKEFNNNIYFFWAVIIITFLLYIIVN